VARCHQRRASSQPNARQRRATPELTSHPSWSHRSPSFPILRLLGVQWDVTSRAEASHARTRKRVTLSARRLIQKTACLRPEALCHARLARLLRSVCLHVKTSQRPLWRH
jgi:hypothetical protein